LVGPAVGPTAAPARRRDRRHERHDATRQEILATAWQLVRAEGVPALSLRALARAVGVEPQSLYSYFESKHAIYDAMFAEGNRELLARLERLPDLADPVAALRARAHEFVRFCTEDPARYQLMFQRTIPGFEPSEESYAVAVRIIEIAREDLAAAGVTDRRGLDLYTGLVAGLIAQQLANEPQGDRWVGLVDEALDMFFEHVHRPRRLP
jgi:AcrR family transcriptional regulator